MTPRPKEAPPFACPNGGARPAAPGTAGRRADTSAGMLVYAVRRMLVAVPTLLVISLILFLLLDLAPGDPTAQLPLTIPPEVKEKIRLSLGLGEPVHVRYLLWL